MRCLTVRNKRICYVTVMLTRPAGHEAKARKSEAEDEAEAHNYFRGRGRGHNV